MRAVAEEGSLARAALRLHVTPSALSHQLRDVETRLGTPLFLRVGKRMVPTAAGERLARSAQEILAALASAERAIHLFAGGERGRLRVIVAGYASYRWLPSVLQRYRERHPKIEVQMPEPAGPDPLTDVLGGTVDVAISARTADDKRLHCEPLVRDEVVLAVPPGHRLAGRPFAAIDDHQTLNARHFAQGGAARVIAERELTPSVLASALRACLADLGTLTRMAEAAHAQAKHSVAERIAAACVAAAEARA